jgi:hypothetical protein
MNNHSPQSFRNHPIPGEAMMGFPQDSVEAEKHRLLMRAFDDWPDDLAGQLLALKGLLQTLDVLEEWPHQSAD